MESRFQTSFIPKKPIDTGSGNTVQKTVRPPSLFRIISVFIFLASLALWGGILLWKAYLNHEITADQSSLAASEKEFDLGTVNTLTRLNNRLNASESIIASHLAISKVFIELENVTLKNIQFTDMTLGYGGTTKGLVLTLKGHAASYAAVAKQSDLFNQDRNFESPLFSDLNLDQTGAIVFTVNTNLDPKNFLYTADGGSSSNPTSAVQNGAITPSQNAAPNSPFNQ